MAFKFKQGESLQQGVHRILIEETENAAFELGGGNPNLDDGIHNARKSFKKIRSVLRLVRPELDKSIYRRENAWFRDAGRQLATVREAEALLETCDRMAKHFPKLADSEAFILLRKSLEERRERITISEQDLEEKARELSQQLQAVPERLNDFSLKKSGFSAIAPGIKRSYQEGRKTMKNVYESSSEALLHDWRKRVKDYLYQCRLLRRCWPKVMNSRIDQLNILAELLGDEHDLMVFQQVLVAEQDELGDTAFLNDFFRDYQQELSLASLKLGNKLYKQTPTALHEKIRSRWKKWH